MPKLRSKSFWRSIPWPRLTRRSRAVIVVAMLAPIIAAASWHASTRGATSSSKGTLVWLPPAPAGRWTCIVIHHSATDIGGAERFGKAHRAKGWDDLGYHFVIGNGSDTPNGQVEVGPRWQAQKHGAHCKTADEYYNAHGIGICLVGNFDESQPSAAQTRVLTRLVAELCRKYDIPPSKVLVHGGITGKTHCPGEHFDLPALRAAVSRSR